jgi:phosphoenolpyruvate carboxykinase (ATP)
VPSQVLNPILTWEDQAAYHHQARMLIERFEGNFSQFEAAVAGKLGEAGPHCNV